MKIGQLLADPTTDDPLRSLLSGIDALPFDELRPAIERSLGRSLEDVFSAFERAAVAASLGQVHRATLHTGDDVAVKVQYPFIADAVEAELRLAGLVPGIGPVHKWGFDLDGYRRVLRDNMRHELDYRSEAQRQERFAREVRVNGLVVPEVFGRWCSERLLVQSFEAGAALDEATNWPRTARLGLGRILVETLLHGLFRAGLVHGDPHAGNYRFRVDSAGRPEVVLLDYGSCIEVADGARAALFALIEARRGVGRAEPFDCFVAMGFSARHLEPIASSLVDLSDALLAPFLSEGPFDTRSWRLGARFEQLLGELRWWFRAAGPPELFLLLRAFQGVVQQLEALDVALPWWPLAKRATRGLEFASLPSSGAYPERHGAAEPSARLLKVRVVEGDVTLVSLAFPAREALRLTEIVPGDVQSRIRASGDDLHDIQARLAQRGVHVGPLLDRAVGVRRYEVWLE